MLEPKRYAQVAYFAFLEVCCCTCYEEMRVRVHAAGFCFDRQGSTKEQEHEAIHIFVNQEIDTMKSFALLALAGSAAAFAPASQQGASVRLQASLDDMPGSTAPIKNFDPLGYSTIGSEETLRWFRAGELKNGRVAMLATTGYIVQASGIHFPGMLSKDVSFESLSKMKPFDAWEAVPDAGKAQILGTIFVAELASECQGTHYMKGGAYPTIVFPPVDFSGVSAETMKIKQDRELNNGRLAMIAIMSFIAANNVPGSVPALAGNPMF